MEKNITVNCVSPGFIMSDMTNKISEDHTNLLKSRISLNKFGNPEDVANTVAFLSSIYQIISLEKLFMLMEVCILVDKIIKIFINGLT